MKSEEWLISEQLTKLAILGCISSLTAQIAQAAQPMLQIDCATYSL